MRRAATTTPCVLPTNGGPSMANHCRAPFSACPFVCSRSVMSEYISETIGVSIGPTRLIQLVTRAPSSSKLQGGAGMSSMCSTIREWSWRS